MPKYPLARTVCQPQQPRVSHDWTQILQKKCPVFADSRRITDYSMRTARCRLVSILLTLAVCFCFTAGYASCLYGMSDDCCEDSQNGVPCTDSALCHCACALASSMPVVMVLEFHTLCVGELREAPVVSTYPDVMTELDRPPRPC